MDNVKPIMASANTSNFEFELPEPGQYLARCFRIIDEGTHLDVYPNSKFPAKPTHRVMFYFEILQDEEGNDVRMADGRPFSISKKYTLSLHEKAGLRKDLEIWRGIKFSKEEAESFDITKVLDKFCTIAVTHESSKDGDRTFAVLAAIMKTNKKTEGVNPISTFAVNDPDPEMFATFSEFMQKRLNESDEMKDNPLPVISKEERQAACEQSGDVEIEDVNASEDIDKAGF